jgi:undecaprenyl-diphosphatase
LGARWVVRHQAEVRERGRRILDRRLPRALRGRYGRQLDFFGRRLNPTEARGLTLTITLLVLIVAGWAFGALTQDVITAKEALRLDGRVLDWFVAHREPWLTRVMEIVTMFGNPVALVPIVIAIGGWWWWRRRTVRPLVLLAAAYVGSELLVRTVKFITVRPRPPSAVAVQHYDGWSFPSGYAALSIAVWGAVAAVIASATPSWRTKVAVWAGALLVAVMVGVSRLYLGAHWFSDVLGGWALGAAWLAAALVAVGPLHRAPHPRA